MSMTVHTDDRAYVCVSLQLGLADPDAALMDAVDDARRAARSADGGDDDGTVDVVDGGDVIDGGFAGDGGYYEDDGGAAFGDEEDQ